jgi:hypothetical protein
MDALAAHDTGALAQVFAQGRYYQALLAAFFETEGVNGLDSTTGLQATAAEDTFVRITEEGRCRGILGQASELELKGIVPDAVFSCQALQFAVFVADAVEAIMGMMGQDKFEDGFAGFNYFGAAGSDLHFVHDRLGTGCLEKAAAFNFTDTDPAVGFDGLVRVMAEGRELDPGLLGCL